MRESDLDNRPWTEAQWEAFMERQDIRSAKFGELMNTFMDHPDQDQIIAREMGWSHEQEDDEWDAQLEAMNQATAEYETLSDEEKARLRKADREKLEAIPAYKEGFRYGLKVHGALKPYMEAVPEGQEPDEDLFIAFRDCLIIAVKIAGGHGVGYEDDALCGNIVRCKRSLQAANQCLVALHSLRDRGFASSDHIDPLITEGQEVRDLVAKHIADLRSRVWWE